MTKKKWLISIVVALLLAVAAGLTMYFAPVFKVAEIEVRGAHQVSVEEIQQATGIQEGENLLQLDTTAAAAGVASHPWVYSATVSRSLPSTVVVEVSERVPVAFRHTPQGTQLIDERGEPFVFSAPEGVMEITGSAVDSEEVLAGAVNIARALPPHMRELVSSIVADGLYSYTLNLHDGRSVMWGEAVDNENKALAFEAIAGRGGEHWDISNPTLVTSR